jgi:hypothetical protein
MCDRVQGRMALGNSRSGPAFLSRSSTWNRQHTSANSANVIPIIPTRTRLFISSSLPPALADMRVLSIISVLAGSLFVVACEHICEP